MARSLRACENITLAAELSVPRPSHENNFGLLRLTFAMLVIVSHSIELVDGNRSREPLTQLFGTLSSGELGVDGFFLVSGYLITQSYERSSSIASYLWKRFLRIYPAFIVASAISVLIVAPLSGVYLTDIAAKEWAKSIFRIAALQPASLPGTFPDQHYHELNGSMWTIAYEFRCYLAVIVLGMIGLLNRPFSFLAILIAFLIGVSLLELDLFHLPYLRLELIYGTPKAAIRLTSFFLAGAAFYLFRDRIVFRNWIAAAVGATLCGLLFIRYLADPALAIFGGYLVFWFAFLPNTQRLNLVNSKTDISYGAYLYAWPIQNLVIRYDHDTSPWLVMIITIVGSCVLAYLSWIFIEKPSLDLKQARTDDSSRRPSFRYR